MISSRAAATTAHQGAGLFGSPPAVNLGVGLVVFGGIPAQLAGSGRRGAHPDFGDEYRAQDRAHSGDDLDRSVAAVTTQPVIGDLTGEAGENISTVESRLMACLMSLI